MKETEEWISNEKCPKCGTALMEDNESFWCTKCGYESFK